MKRISGFMAGLLALVMMEHSDAQTTYPEKPIRLVVGFPPGSQADTVARLFSQKLAESMGKHFVVDNAAGAAGNIAADRIAKATQDGYTLGFLANGQIIFNPSLYQLPFDSIKDFTAVSQVALSPNMLVVHNAVPAKNVQELVKLARTQPDGITFASGGSGSLPHMAAELFKLAAGINIRHIPYKGVVAAIPDMVSGRVTMMFSPISIVLPMARDGKLRALAVTSLKRTSTIPELPTIAESGFPGFEVTLWYGLLAPAGTPGAIVNKLYAETVKALTLSDLRAKLGDLGVEGVGSTPDVFAASIKSEMPKWAKVIKEAGIKPE